VARGTGTRAGAYAQQSFSISSRVHLSLGVRGDAHSASSIRVASPYASISYQPLERTSLHLDWGQYGQFPELSQFFSGFTTGGLQPERATHYELAIEHRLDDHTRVRVEFYDRQDRDLLARPLLDPRVLANGTIFNPLPNAPWGNTQRGY